MNPAKAYAHLFSPRGGDEADNYRAPGQITFLRSDHVALDAGKLRDAGARNSLNPKDWIDLAKERGIRFHPMFELLERGVDTGAAEAIAQVWEGTDAQYLSFNFNVMDASMAPGVTATEPGGIESREMMRIAGLLGARGGVSVIDISELCPIYDVSGTTSRLAVCVVLRVMAAIAQSRGELVDQSLRRPAS